MYCICLYIIIYILWLWIHVSYLRDKMNAIIFISIFYEKIYCIKRNTRREVIYLNSDIILCISEVRVVNTVISGQQVSGWKEHVGCLSFYRWRLGIMEECTLRTSRRVSLGLEVKRDIVWKTHAPA